MTRTITIDRRNSIRSLVFLVMAVCFAFLAVKLTFGEEASGSAQNAKKYNITFPVVELGNCASIEECKAYCGEVANQQACMDFAKKKGLPRKEEKGLNKELLEKANAFLGCSNEQTCKLFCQDKANFEKCSMFARENKLRGGMRDASRSGELKRGMMGGPEGSRGAMLEPKMGRGFENASSSAKFCKENPEKCRMASGSADLKERRMMEERYKKEHGGGDFGGGQGQNRVSDEMRNNDQGQNEQSQVQGVSTSTSIFQQIYRFLFK